MQPAPVARRSRAQADRDRGRGRLRRHPRLRRRHARPSGRAGASRRLHDRDPLPAPARPGEPWDRPSDIRIRDCTVFGHVRIWGMGENGQGPLLRDSSRSLGHTERAQDAAPTGVTITGTTIVAAGPIPLYLGPGVTRVTLTGSRLAGRSVSTALYLDAERRERTASRTPSSRPRPRARPSPSTARRATASPATASPCAARVACASTAIAGRAARCATRRLRTT